MKKKLVEHHRNDSLVFDGMDHLVVKKQISREIFIYLIVNHLSDKYVDFLHS